MLRIPDFILAQGQTALKTTLFTTGPYMDMLFDGMYVPKQAPDGTVVWANPAGKLTPLKNGSVRKYIGSCLFYNRDQSST